MKTALSSALRVICALCFLLSLVEGSNNTTISEDGTTRYTGWHKGPAERGTMTILWSCLTTVFACTWTILHLNVPYFEDGKWTKILRKIKWMAITIIFPEFIFAKAVCELQMAIEDLRELKNHEGLLGWEVEYGRGCRILYWLFHPHRTSSSRPPPAVTAPGSIKSRKRWTLTHCYFANMGGMVFKASSDYSSDYDQYLPVTAHALAMFCVPNTQNLLDENLLDETCPTQEEILDKSKADNLLKAVAALQILWLILSVITRKIYGLPISLLEVCTVAFAALSVATYVANLEKPKDVDVPALLNGNYEHIGNKHLLDLCGESFFARTVVPTGQHGPKLGMARIKNDMLRLQAHGTQHLTLTYALAVSTICFGAIHCAAWQNYFPSQVERRLWQVSSVLSSTLPLTNLLALFASNVIMGRKAHKVMTSIGFLMGTASGPTSESDRRTNLTRVKFWWKDGELFLHGLDSKGQVSVQDIHDLELAILGLLEVEKEVGKGEASRSWCTEYLRRLSKLDRRNFDIAYELENTPEDNLRAGSIKTSIPGSSAFSVNEMLPILKVINHPQGISAKLSKEWDSLVKWVDITSIGLTILSGLLYATARLMLLALAFAAFRKQDERLYVDTWARFLPSIG